MRIPALTISFTLSEELFAGLGSYFERHLVLLITLILTAVSVASFIIFYQNGLGLAYNDARSHLDIGRRVVEGLKPGIAQIGSVWLPLPHVLMIPTIWNDFMWHSGLSGALISMVSYIGTGVFIYLFLKHLGVGVLGRLAGVFIFAANINVLYLQSTAMTEPLLILTLTGGTYELLRWVKDNQLLSILKASFWIMLATLVRYDGWFLLLFATLILLFLSFKKWGYKVTEGVIILFLTLGGLGIFLWFVWNQLIFGDALYFVFGPYAARTQQEQLQQAGVLATQGNLLFSIKVYLLAVLYNAGAFSTILAFFGMIMLWLDKKISKHIRVVSLLLLTPLIFYIVTLYLGHSVLFIQGLSGNTWFNVRYGAIMIPSIAIFVGFLIHKLKPLRATIVGLLIFVTFFAFANVDAVTIDDARVGSSQKNVSEVSGWLAENAKDKKGFILISAASHDAIIFSSGLPMKKFIHEGTGNYWESATTGPEHWARWIVMRTHDINDQTFKLVKDTPGFSNYDLVDSYPFADIYQLRDEYLDQLNTEPNLPKQR